ncbi:uncharacterized protein LOC126661709 [Mercurialis annua]|uniref:uncharacterized protein LOC126661709 n=1 Tax=Mercurialis annua TaxID=3986 RepID=UPI00215EF90A|nr:uncharacterized protein LOC126661709 [Mercurialis annua]
MTNTIWCVPLVRVDVCTTVKAFLDGALLPRGLNHTTITLIPKVSVPTSMDDLRPISLCPAHELTHYLKTRRENSKFELALMLDMSKAYERIEWNFVKKVMRKLGFDHQWIRWIMVCISSVSYSVALNEVENHINRIKIARRSPEVSHLLFTDDSLLFFQANRSQAKKVSELLSLYCDASGQQINRNKSSIFYGRNIPVSIRQQLGLVLEVRNSGGQDKYLGLPALVNKSKAETFKEIIVKVHQKVSGWQGNLLSNGGREPDTLISRVFKGRYFPHDSFLDTEHRSNRSSAWQSILWGKFVLSKGICWQVRSGDHILVRDDLWIPITHPFKIDQGTSIPQAVSTFADFIDRNAGVLKEILIKSIFTASDANAILSFPISLMGGRDKIIWNYTNNDKFSVKLAYHLAFDGPNPNIRSISIIRKEMLLSGESCGK